MEEFYNQMMSVVERGYSSYKLTHVTYGEVKSVNPLRISIDQKITLSERMLALSRNVTDYKVDIDVGDTGTKVTSTVYNALKVGEMVALVSFKSGQRYLVIDRV